MGLDKWQDSAHTRVEVGRKSAGTYFFRAYRPWALADRLNRFVRVLHRRDKTLVNPKMKFKVLVSMHHMRWNERRLYR